MYGYLFLAIIAVFSWFLVNLASFDESGPDSVLAKGPDFFSANYTKWQMDEQGVLKNKLFADKMVHYRDDGKTHFTNPQYTLFSDSNNNVKHQQTPPWVITSDSGISSADGKDLLLNGKVAKNLYTSNLFLKLKSICLL